ncbi:MAG: ribbon-helix-helix domain-containing protein [Ignisphaera sp.]|nr:ribbon-helix-helix domain-containing protein [Ignisphaera sp.]
MFSENMDYIELNIRATKIVSVKLDADMIHDVDKMVKKHNFRNRSEFIREALNLYIELLNTHGRSGCRRLFSENMDYIELNIRATKIVSVKLDADMIHDVDKMVKKHNFRNRSEFIREALNLYIELLNMYDKKELKDAAKNRLKVAR